ncbi:MAG: OmpA family protein [Polyangiales bacterium]
MKHVWLKCALTMCAGLLATNLATSSAEAQSFRLNRFRGAERPDDGFGVRRLGEFGHLRFGANATVDYANDPLVLRRNRTSRDELQSIVDHQLTLKLDVSLALWNRLILLAGFDAPLLMKGPDVEATLAPEADGPGFGDVSLGLRLRLVGDADDVFGLGVQAVVVLPTTGSSQHYSGEDAVAVRPELIADIRTRVLRIYANAGVLAHKKVDILGRTLGSELVYGLGASVPLHPRFELLGELSGGFDFEHFAARTSTGVEWLLGGKANTTSGWWFGAGAGSGFTRGIGTPDVRAIGQIGYLTPIKKKEEPAPVPVEKDSDGDGILDSVDQCPDKPEDRDGFADEDGCPDPDNDGDGILDAADQCANEPEDRDGFADEDGCPDPDNDGDTVLDADDACPTEAGPVENKGCPAKVTAESDVFTLQKINFENDKAIIKAESEPILERVKDALGEHPEIQLLRIEGHTDGMGAAPYNMRLSRARTSAVAAWLTSHGVERKRLEAHACGELHLIADDATEEGRATNRRVEFVIVKPPADGVDVRRKAGCLDAAVK